MLLLNRLLLVLLAVNLSVSLAAQQKLTMTRTGPEGDEVDIKLKRIVWIETADTTYGSHLIKCATQEGFMLWHYRTVMDTSVVAAYLGSGEDTTIVTERSVADSILVPFSSITAIRTSPLMNARWVQSCAWFGLGAALGLIALPVALIAEGASIWASWLAMEGTLVGLTVHPLPLLLFDRRYRTTEGWHVGPHAL